MTAKQKTGKRPSAKGFTCECGTFHEFAVYVAAHWSVELIHECSDCKRKHAIKHGGARLIGPPKGAKP